MFDGFGRPIAGAAISTSMGYDVTSCREVTRSDEQGRFAGYTFEAAIPLSNFPGFRPRRGTTIGFDIALVDADVEPTQKTYMTLSGEGGLAVSPEGFVYVADTANGRVQLFAPK